MSATNLSGSPSGTPGVPPNPTISAVVACRSPPTSNCYWPTSNIEVTVTQSTVIYNTTLSGGASTNSTAFLWLEVTDSTAQSATLSVSSSDAVTSVSATATAASSNTGAATSAAQSGTSSPSPGRSNDTGAIAGAAVGCFVAGALIAALISFFIFKKRAKRNRNAARGAYVPGSEPRYGGEKGTPMISVAAMGGLDFLPQQAADAEVRTKLSTVIDQIDQHVENFYNNRSIPLDANLESELSRFETSQLAQPLAACFENATNPMLLIKHCLAFHIFNLTVAPGEGTQPLLPQDLAGTVAAIYNRTVSHSASKDTLAAFSTWKALTKYLRPDLMRDPSSSQSTGENVTRIATHFTNVFSPWSNTQYSNEHRNRHLTEVINNAVQTAVWLFGQPDTFKFDWVTPAQDTGRGTVGRNINSVVIVPAVSKVTHNGVRLGGNGQNVLSPAVKSF